MDWLIEFASAPAPLWAALLLIALAGAAGWWWGHSVEPADRPATVRAEKFAADRVAVQQPATAALTRVLAVPGEVAGSDLPPRGATVDVTAIAADYPPLDLYGTDDERGDDRDPPAGGGAVPAEAYQAAILPRYRWTGADPWPADRGVMPDRWSMLRWRVGRWTTGALEAWGRLRTYLTDRWEAAGWVSADETPWVQGELAVVDTAELFPAAQHRGDGQAGHADYEPRHDFAEVPPSIAVPLAMMDPVARARELVRQLGQRGWLPPADRRLRSRRSYTFPVASLPILGCAP